MTTNYYYRGKQITAQRFRALVGGWRKFTRLCERAALGDEAARAIVDEIRITTTTI